jgi:biotin carboxylase
LAVITQTGKYGDVQRVAIILSSETYRATAFVEAARDLGVRLTVVSERRQLLLDKADFLLVDLDNPIQAAADIVERHVTTPFMAIVPVDDQGVLVAAHAAHDLKLAHNHPAAVAITREKAMLRRALRDKVPQPPFVVVERSADPAQVASELTMPLVIKPLSLAASQGVIRIDSPEEAPEAVARIRRILACTGRSPNEPLLFERFVPGQEVAVEGVLISGRLKVLAVLDKPDPLDGPFFEESLYITPSRHHPEVLAEVAATTQRAIDAIGLTEGPIHAELRIDGSFVRVIEVAARPIGGLCGQALQFGLLGTSLETMLLRAALGMRIPEIRPYHAASGVMMLPTRTTGFFRGVKGIEAALKVAGITKLTISIPIGERVEAWPEGNRYLGFLFARAGRPEHVEEALRAAFEKLTIEIDEVPTESV